MGAPSKTIRLTTSSRPRIMDVNQGLGKINADAVIVRSASAEAIDGLNNRQIGGQALLGFIPFSRELNDTRVAKTSRVFPGELIQTTEKPAIPGKHNGRASIGRIQNLRIFRLDFDASDLVPCQDGPYAQIGKVLVDEEVNSTASTHGMLNSASSDYTVV